MKKTIKTRISICLLTALICSSLLSGCSLSKKEAKESYPEWDNCKLETERFGANDDESPYFCYLASLDDKDKRMLMAYDTVSGESKELFRQDDPTSFDISYFLQQGNTVYLEIGYGKSYYECDLTTWQVQELPHCPDALHPARDYSLATVDCGNDKTVHFKKSVGDGHFYYSFDGENYEEMYNSLKGSLQCSGFYDKNLAFIDGKVYGVVTAMGPLHNGSFDANFPLYDNMLYARYEFLFSFNPETCIFEILHETQNTYSHIIGFNDNCMYVYKTGGISKVNLESGEIVHICDVDVKNAIFGCRGTKIVVYNPDKEEVVAVIDMNEH